MPSSEAHSPRCLRNVREVQSHSELAAKGGFSSPSGVDRTARPEGCPGKPPAALGMNHCRARQECGTRSDHGGHAIPGAGRARGHVACCQHPGLSRLSVSVRGAHPFSKWGTASSELNQVLCPAPTGLAVHPRFLPTPPPPTSCPLTARHPLPPPAYTGARTPSSPLPVLCSLPASPPFSVLGDSA